MGDKAAMVLEKELRVLHLHPQAADANEHRRPQSHPHSDMLPPIRPHLLIVPLPMGAIFFQTTTHDHFQQPRYKDGFAAVKC